MSKPEEESIQPATKLGPVLSLRFRNAAEVKAVKKAAKKTGLSTNTWAIEVLTRAAEAAQQ